MFQKEIDEAFVRRSPEAWLAESLRESQQQTAELKRFNTDLALSIADALDERMAKSLSPALDRLLDAVQDLTEFKKESSDRAFGHLAEEFRRSLTGAASSEIDALSQALGQTSQLLRQAVEDSASRQDSLQKEFGSQIGRLTNSVEEALEMQQRQLQETTQATRSQMELQVESLAAKVETLIQGVQETMSRSSETMQNENRELSQLIRDRVGDVAEHFEREGQVLGELFGRLQRTGDSMEDLLPALRKSGEALRSSGPALLESAGLISRGLGDFKETHAQFLTAIQGSLRGLTEQSARQADVIGQIRTSLEKTEGSWRVYEEKFGEIQRGLRTVFDQVASGLRDYREITESSIREYMAILDGTLKESVGTLAGMSDGIREINEELADMVDRINGRSRRGI